MLEVDKQTLVYKEDLEVVASGKTEKAAWLEVVDKSVELLQERIRTGVDL